MFRKYCSECGEGCKGEMIECPLCGRELLIENGSLLGGKYRIRRLIGKGGMSQVYLAHQENLKRDVALKIAPPPVIEQTELREALVNEAFKAAQLSHPNIVTVYDYGQIEYGHLFLAMEYLDGKSLAELIVRTGPLHYTRAIYIASQICDAVSYVHKKGLVHRDLKPGNIVVTSTTGNLDHIKLLDFGLTTARRTLLERLGLFRLKAGTPMYMSPEQLRGDAVDHRSDLYAIGVITYEMLTGKSLFSGMESIEERERFVPPPLSMVLCNSNIPQRLDDLVIRLLSSNPNLRPSNAQELAVRFRALLPSVPREPIILTKRTTPTPLLPDQLLENKHVQINEPDIVGHEKQKNEFANMLKDVEKGIGAIHWMVGSEGMGKTTLGRCFIDMANRKGIKTVVSEGGGRGAMMGFWREVMRNLLGFEGPVTHGQVKLRLQGLGILDKDTIDGISDLLYPSKVAIEWMRENKDGYETYVSGAMEVVLWHLTKNNPMAFFMDDFHQADDMSCSFLLRLFDLMKIHKLPIAVLIASKDCELDESKSMVKQTFQILKVLGRTSTIDPLSNSEIETLVNSCLNSQVSDKLLSYIANTSAGNPMFAVELVKHLWTSNALQVSKGVVRLRPESRIRTPNNLIEVLARRIEHLKTIEPNGALAFDLLIRICVLEPYSSKNFITELLGKEKRLDILENLGGLIRLLETQDFLEEMGEGADAKLMLKSPMIRDTVFRRVGKDSNLYKLHLLSAQILEQAFPYDIKSCAKEIGEHYKEAGFWDRAIDYLMLAADDLLEQGNYKDAKEILLETEACLKKLGIKNDLRSGRLSLSISELDIWEGNFLEAEARLKTIINQMNLLDSYEKMRVLSLRAKVAEAKRKNDEALNLMSEIYKECKAKQDKVRIVTCLLDMARIRMNQGDNEQARRDIEMAESLVEGDTDTRIKGLVYLTKGRFLWKSGTSNQAAMDYLTKSQELLNGRRDIPEKAESLYFQGVILWENKQLEDALKIFDQGVNLCETYGFVRGLAAHLTNRGGVLLYLKRYDEGREDIMRAMMYREWMNDALGLGQCLTALSDLAIERKAWDSAVELAEKAINNYRKAGWVLGERVAEYNKAKAYFYKGDLKQAEEHLKMCLATENRDKSKTVILAKAHEMLMKIYSNIGEIEKAKEHEKKAMDVYTELGLGHKISGMQSLGHPQFR